MEADVTLATARALALALAVGALVGIEREKRKAEEGTSGVGGLRTFILLALLGALGGWLTRALGSPWPLVAVVAAAAALVLASYLLEARTRPDQHLGLTTEIAAAVVTLLGAVALLGQELLAAGLGVVAAATLAYKQPLHGLVARLGWDDVFAGLRLAIASFVVLPLLPDRPLDPWGVLNPHRLWLLVILISSLSLVGYVATRWLGSGRATAVTGLTGGLVSSTAVTLSFARESRGGTADADALAAGILLAWAVMFARVVVITAAIEASLLVTLALPMGVMGAACVALAVWFLRHALRGETAGGQPRAVVPLENPFSLLAAARFAAFFAAVLVVVAVVREALPGQGVYVVAALAGLTDVDAITLSMAGGVAVTGPTTAVAAIVVACLSNTAVKTGMVVALGSAGLRWRVLVASCIVVAAGAGALVVARG